MPFKEEERKTKQPNPKNKALLFYCGFVSGMVQASILGIVLSISQ